MDGDITAFYADNVELQWERFASLARIEERVLHLTLRKHLPQAPAIVADIGGGNGRHAFTLASWGYSVMLCDVTTALIEDARSRDRSRGGKLASIALADARDLPWPDRSCDAALLLGPLYCLANARDRARVLAEARRVVRPGGIVFAQFFLRAAALRSLLEMTPARAAIFDWKTFLATGVLADEHIPSLMRLHYFTTVHEALHELRNSGFTVTEYRGMDGPSPGFGQGRLARAPAAIVRQWGDICYELCGFPEYVNTSTHLLVVATAP